MIIPAKLQKIPYDADTKIYQPIQGYQGTVQEYDYIDEEYFASGEEDGRPYTTWVRVCRPRNPENFSGTVIMEPLHFYGNTPIFSYTSRYVMRSGHAWLSVGSPKTALDRLIKPSNPERYAALNIEAEPLSERAAKLDYLTVASFPDEEGKYWWEQLNNQNRAANAIIAQVGAAMKKATGPLEGYDVKNVILAGHSYTCCITTRFIREAHDTMRMEDGKTVFDGFFPSGWPSKPFENVGVPIVQCITEDDLSSVNKLPYRLLNSGMDYRRPDSDEPGDCYRLYEFGSFGHTSTQYPPINDIRFLEVMDPSIKSINSVMASTLPFNEMHQMALNHLIRWVSDGIVPPKAERLVMDNVAGVIFKRDEFGNTLGGVRCVNLDVPRSRYEARRKLDDGSIVMRGFGAEGPFDQDKLRELYGTKENYLNQYNERLDNLIAEGWFLKEDAESERKIAEKVEF